jgi:hypothetical protein
MNRDQTSRPPHHAHHDRDIEEIRHDAYREKGKPHGPAACPVCGAVFDNGRWHWGPRPEAAHDHVCPACLRVREQQPAGYVRLEGEFFEAHRTEILKLVRNIEERARSEHVLERVMAIEHDRDCTNVTTTDIHLARGIGEALYRAYHGKLDVSYSPNEYLVRVAWSR